MYPISFKKPFKLIESLNKTVCGDLTTDAAYDNYRHFADSSLVNLQHDTLLSTSDRKCIANFLIHLMSF